MSGRIDLLLTDHALRRMHQRGIRRGAVEAALLWGREVPQHGGRRAFIVGRREARWAADEDLRADELDGVIVVASEDLAVVTVIRDRRGLRDRNRAARLHRKRDR